MDAESTLLVHLLCGNPWIFLCSLQEAQYKECPEWVEDIHTKSFQKAKGRFPEEALIVHSSAIQADLLQQMSVFHQNYVEKK